MRMCFVCVDVLALCILQQRVGVLALLSLFFLHLPVYEELMQVCFLTLCLCCAEELASATRDSATLRQDAVANRDALMQKSNQIASLLQVSKRYLLPKYTYILTHFKNGGNGLKHEYCRVHTHIRANV